MCHPRTRWPWRFISAPNCWVSKFSFFRTGLCFVFFGDPSCFLIVSQKLFSQSMIRYQQLMKTFNSPLSPCVRWVSCFNILSLNDMGGKVTRWYLRFLPTISSVQFSHSVMSGSLRLHGLQHARPPCPSQTPGVYSNSCSVASVMPSNHLILRHPLLLLPSIFPSIRVFSNESVLHIRWTKYQSFSFNISPSREYSGLISFRMDWLDLVVIQGTLKSLFQHHSSKASIL